MTNIPKDRQIIVEHAFGKSVARWSEADNKFVYASERADMYHGEWNMFYFENEYIEEKDIISWCEL